MTLNIAILYGSVRHHREGIKGARFVEQQCKSRGHYVSFLDPLEKPLPMLDKMHKEYEPGEAPENIEECARLIKNADAYIVVSGEYNHSIPPALKNMLDHFQQEYLFKPAGIATYSAGIFGGARASVHLRAILGELGMATISSMFPMMQVGQNFDENGNTSNEKLDKSFQKFIGELEWYGQALKNARKEGTPF